MAIARVRPTLAASVVTAGVLALAACGSSTASSSGSSPVLLGLIGPLTGARADVGQGMVTGAKLALDVINADGGVLGGKVNLDVQDDAADPGDAVPAAQKEIQSDSVVGIVGPTSLTDSVVLPLAVKANIPNLMWGGGAAFDAIPNSQFFRMSPSDTEQADAMTVYAHAKGYTKVALAIGNQSADQSLVPGIVASAAKLGMTITNQVTIAVGSTSFRSEIQQLFSQQPQAILAQFDIPSAGVLFGELKQEGLTSTPWVASNLWFASEFLSSVGNTLASGPIYIANSGTENQGYPGFLKALTKYDHTTQPSNGETYMYDAVNIWALGAQEAGTTSSPGIEKGIEKVANGPGTQCFDYTTCLSLLKSGKSINYEGAASSVDFDAHHNVFGPFDIIHYNADGTSTSVQELTPQQIQQALGAG
jgi:ABC-type branched-subunit amino acid transport system substrate-binding protein